jgi:signal transduction histidine kinase
MRRVLLARGTGQHRPLTATKAGDDELAQLVHDLRNPLATIALEVELVSSQLGTGKRLDATSAIDRIRRNIGFLDRLIYDVIDVCTLSAGRLALRRSPCELGHLLADVIERVVPTADRSRVTLETGDAAEAMIDALRIERVIANLLDNALKYTPANGPVVVRLTREARSAQISICDAGPGLSPAEIEIVFEPYQRASTSRGRAGTGLGLYVSKQIVEAHGGSIGVESVRGVGARFFFALPMS